MTFRSILCATDFSPGARRALEVAVALAKRDDAALTIVHAFQPPYPVYAGEYVFQGLSEAAGEALEIELNVAKARGAPHVTSRFVLGVPWLSVVQLADDVSAIDLVVVGTHGRTGAKRFLLGSVAEKILRHAPCSVLAVHETIATNFDHVVCPTDFSDEARVALSYAVKLAEKRLTLMHSTELPLAYGAEPDLTQLDREIEERARARLEELATATRATTPIPVETSLRVGTPGWKIPDAVEADPSVSLVVIGSRGRTGIKRILLGSVAERVARHVRCPVLVARDREVP